MTNCKTANNSKLTCTDSSTGVLINDTWEKSNDPSPIGWRVPTLKELKSLSDTTKVHREWTNVNNILGMRFMDKDNGNSIFLPTTGGRGHEDGALYNRDVVGFYWSSTQEDNRYAYLIMFAIDDTYSVDYNSRDIGLAVRPVAE